MNIRFGSRGSKLALLQTNHVMKLVTDNFDHVEVSKTVIKTLGDKVTNLPLFKVGGQGLFIKEIENALLDNRIDVAVHSLKDMPSEVAEGLSLFAVGSQEDYRDCFLSKKYSSLDSLPPNSKVGTSSLRRRAQIAAIRKDLVFTDFRGNLDTRLKKLDAGEVDAIILATAGLKRFGWEDKITEYFSIDKILPPAGQGLLALECRDSDKDKLLPFFTAFINELAMVRSNAERAFLVKIQGGCKTPLGVFADVNGNEIKLSAFMGKEDGSSSIKDSLTDTVENATALGIKLAELMISQGGKEFLVIDGNN